MSPCPFCEEKKPVLHHIEHLYWVGCVRCLCRGPKSYDRETAIRAWEARSVKDYLIGIGIGIGIRK